jgi:hypothetical protein
MSSLAYYIEHAPDLAQNLVNEWARIANARHAENLTPAQKNINEEACQYQAVRRNTDFERKRLIKRSASAAEQAAFLEREERAQREAFGKAYKKFQDNRERQ